MNRHIDHPSLKVPIRTWWKDVYDHVFIAPYPFLRIRSHIRDSILSPCYEETLEHTDQPDDFDDTIKSRGEPISWREIHLSIAPEVSKPHFYRAVWLLSCIGFQERGDIKLQEKINTYCENNRIYLPEDDAIPSILHQPLMKFLSKFGRAHVVAWDEFREHSVELRLTALAPEKSTFYLRKSRTSTGIWALHLPDPGVLITAQFDGTEALIAMSDRALTEGKPEDFFEIEQVDELTYCDWLNPREFFRRDI